ncbi:beta/alpha barrel domain-containing protein [Portibacter lacus]|uniref:Isopentenyl-diphosphate delta-isomerase n=1 Tax=Portibacter lacus TaxID=1099794 RepID=A0AA37SQE9_9BACT|nr:isopentenyl-diphosphate delta-isomerase [Portibacter lacus]GLR17809.1 isopentenyl-diphosphate delta-isomerase [Portibacter lacus]
MSSNPSNVSKIDPTSKSRKLDHIEMAFESQITPQNIDPRFYYEPLLSGHPNKANDSTFRFLDKQFTFPLWVSSMTGGTAYAGIINENLAKACNEFGFGMGLGSCRGLLYDDENFNDFDVRKHIGDQALYANLGIAQVEELINNGQLNKANELVKSLQADGLIIHVNPLQEWLQPEGDVIANPPIDTIKRVLDTLDLKIIVKEVGQGMGYESLKALFKLPLEAIDFAANGGTNFAKLEMHRATEAVRESYRKIANLGHSADEMVTLSNQIIEELKTDCLCKQVIVSGGVRDFLDGYYYIERLNVPAIYGQASAFLKYAREDYEQLRQYVDAQVSGLRLAKAFLKIKES